MRSRRKIAVALLLLGLIVVVVVFITGIAVIPPRQSAGVVGPVVIVKSTCSRPAGFFLITADLSGFNDSIGHGAPVTPWPVIRVNQGDAVGIVVCNEDKTQPHGFAISTYFPRGVAIMPGDAYRITFTANVPGTFVMYCNIFCTIHVFMVGRLIVLHNS